MTAVKPRVETAQDSFELKQLRILFRDLDPVSVLEIGVWHGGTLWYWLRGPRLVCAIDTMTEQAKGEREEWKLWAEAAGSRFELLEGSSSDPGIVEAARLFSPYDFIFIDADHSYESVSADWLNYGPMLAAGGMVAFHDIRPREQYGVSRLWDELKPGNRTVEIWAGQEAYCGIGVIWPR